jgi:flagellar basal-body rod protein FlgG
MLDGMKIATQGMLAMMAKQEVIANNLANVGTAGFQKDTMLVSSFNDVLKKEMAFRGSDEEGGYFQAGGAAEAKGELFYRNATMFSQGSLKETGNSFDLALDDNGKGFFTIQSQEGLKFTRNGSFRLSPSGHIVTQDGSLLVGQKGPINVRGQSFSVSNEGIVSVDGREVDRLLITTFDNRNGLTKVGDNNFVAAGAGSVSSDFRVKQGFLEMSNVNVVKEMVDMLSIMRAYEANQKILHAEDQVLGKASEIGKVR